MRSSRVVRASDWQCQSRNSPGSVLSILRHSGIWGAADEAGLKNVHNKKMSKNHPFNNTKKTQRRRITVTSSLNEISMDPRTWVLLLPLWVLGTHSLVGAGVGDPIRTTGQKPWCSVNYNPFTVVGGFTPLHPQLFIKQASGMTLKDDGNGFLYISDMFYMGNNKKLRRERFNSPATSELIFLDIKNIHCLIVYLPGLYSSRKK